MAKRKKKSSLSSNKFIKWAKVPKHAALVVFVLGFAAFGVYKLAFSSAATSPLFSGTGCTKLSTVSTVKYYGSSYKWNNFSTVKRGFKGTCVKSVQKKLNDYCRNNLVVDGAFGPATERAAKAYQKYWYNKYPNLTVNGKRVSVDGIIGPQSFALMQQFGQSGGGNLSC